MNRYVIKFEKDGYVKYTSHLDILRIFKRSFKKTGLALKYSQGFNPHPKMGFAQPLSLGYSSKCELIEFVETDHFTTVLAKIVNIAADESVLGENGKIDTGKIGMIFYESFSNSYYRLGEKVGKAWSEGKVFMG